MKNLINILCLILVLFSGASVAESKSPDGDDENATKFHYSGITLGMTEAEFEPIVVKKLGLTYKKTVEYKDGSLGYIYKDHPKPFHGRGMITIVTRNGKAEKIDYSYNLPEKAGAFPKEEFMPPLIRQYGWPDAYTDGAPILGTDTGYSACWGDCYVKSGEGNSMLYNGVLTPYRYAGSTYSPKKTTFRIGVMRVYKDRFDPSKGLAYTWFRVVIKKPETQ